MSATGSPTFSHLGVNAVFLEPRMGGIETYVRRLYPAILEARPDLRVSVFVNELGRELLAAEDWSDGVQLVTHRFLGRRGTRAITETTLLGLLADRRGCDVLHSVALTAPFRTRATNVVTIGDVTWLRHRGSVPLHTRLLWGGLVAPVARRADRIIAYSRAARGEISEDLRIPERRIDVVPLGPGAEPVEQATPEAELRSRFGLGAGPIVLAVSPLLPHKNVGTLVEALPLIRRTVPDAVLVVTGHRTSLDAALVGEARSLGVEKGLVLAGWVSPEDLEGLYGAAACFAFPSLREGFGLPVLEAMRRGLPVACSNIPTVLEVADRAALNFNPRSPGEIAGAVTRIITDRALARDLSEHGRARAAQFTWKRAAAGTLASFERARHGR